MHWHELNNIYADKTVAILGRGPTLDDWLSSTNKPHVDAVIGINSVCLETKCDFSVSCDADADNLIGPNTHWVRGLPYVRNKTHEETWSLPEGARDLWFIHSEQGKSALREKRLLQSRDEIAVSRKLYCASSSAHPAVHFAHYLGFKSVIIAGIDGYGGRAKCTHAHPGKTPPPDDLYAAMRLITEQLLNRLFQGQWVRFQRLPPR
jgi:hypothetical protein